MHFGGAHVGGAPRFSGRPAMSRSAARPSFRSQHSFAVRSNPGRAAGRAAALNSNRATSFTRTHNANFDRSVGVGARPNAAVRNALNSRAVAGAMQNRAALRNGSARAQIVASAAMAGWHNGSGSNGWWRHSHGGFGWVGPIFWPFAYYDIYDYAMWGDDPLFWDYGYNDIYAGLFSPYGYDDLLGYLPGGANTRVTVGTARGSSAAANPMPAQLAQMCGDDSREIAGLPIDQIQQAIQPTDAQRAALDELANASVKAAQDIKAACPTQIALTAPSRIAAMQQRIEAMMSGVETVQPALQKFYDTLNDEQRARLNAIAQDQRRGESARNRNGSLVQSCGAGQPGVTDWPTAEIEARLHPTETQRASLAELQAASAKAADMLKASCPTAAPITPPARLEAIHNRLDTMLQAVKLVRGSLDDFYGKLSDEQRAQFEAIGPDRAALSSQPTVPNEPSAARTHARHRHHVSVRGIIRHFMSMARW